MSLRLAPSARTEIRRPLFTSDEGLSANGGDAVAAYLQTGDASGLAVPPGCPVAVFHPLTPTHEQECIFQGAVDVPSGARVAAQLQAMERRRRAAVDEGREPDDEGALDVAEAANFTMYVHSIAKARVVRGLIRIEGADDASSAPSEYIDRLPLLVVSEIAMLIRQAGEVTAMGKAPSGSQPSAQTGTPQG